MSEVRARIGESGRLIVPAGFRKMLGLKIGDEVVMRIEDEELRICGSGQAIRRAQKAVGRYLADDQRLSEVLIAERRAEALRE
jgi:AbrB family looped-hinge helix DNA binding protein